MKKCIPVRGLLGLICLCNLAGFVWGQGDVLTQHNDNQRTGAYLTETQLTPATVNAQQFGRLYARRVNGKILSQPLYVQNVPMGGSTYNVVYVATGSNNIYAFDADHFDPDPNAGLLWKRNLCPAGLTWGMCTGTHGPVGITSTPVIDPDTSTMYVVARDARDSNHYLYALDITSGRDQLPRVKIEAIYRGVRFDPNFQLNRPGLLRLGGRGIYIGFGAKSCDTGRYQGWVIGYRTADLTQTAVFCTTPFGGAGIWQSGAGLAADKQGNIYVMTGNGNYQPAGAQYGDSFIKLSTPDLQPLGSYAPSNHPRLDANDIDLGSGGPTVLPADSRIGGASVIGGGKQGVL